MAVPRKRKSSRRRGNQRSHDALKSPNYNACANCGEPKMPHRACGACGYYAGKAVMEVSGE
ncbi:MAG TPA: 50S ribosomal protein L32 [Myxococcales bacterium LLY-WYZ-16_1]|jgi:large subunit ribosomal protein L32|nr:50S ribosomal protein L32 [Myxococcales bacterium LLY-WYZ-16_1]